MNRPLDHTAAAIEAGLADLTASAPAELRPAVLAEIGLADRYAHIDSPIGPLRVAWNGRGVSVVTWRPATTAPSRRAIVAATGRHAFAVAYPAAAARRAPSSGAWAVTGGSGSTSTCAATARSSRTSGTRRSRSRAARSGRTAGSAAEIGRPRAVRAVGTALGHNPVPLIVPCHRVVRTDGFIGQYSLGGPENKRTILRSEGLDPETLEARAAAGIRYIGLRHDQHRVPAHVPPCPTDDGRAPGRLPVGQGRGRGRATGRARSAGRIPGRCSRRRHAAGRAATSVVCTRTAPGWRATRRCISAASAARRPGATGAPDIHLAHSRARPVATDLRRPTYDAVDHGAA